MGNRNHYLPRKTRLDAMSDHDRATLLGDKLVELANEIVGLKHGEITAWKGGKAYQLKLSRDRLRRLRKAANDYACGSMKMTRPMLYQKSLCPLADKDW